MDETSAPPIKIMRMEEEALIGDYASILHLPPEILVYILSFLDIHTLFMTVARVCKTWNDAVIGDSLWRYFRHLTLERRKTPLPLRNLIEKCSNLTYLEIRAKDCWPKRLINATLFGALSHCRKLRSMSVRHFLIHSDCAVTLQRCLGSLPFLETLDLSYCKLVDEVGDSLSEALARSECLESLHLVGHSSTSKRTLNQVVKRCHPLRNLDLSCCNMSFDEDSLGALFGTHSRTIIRLNLTGNTLFERDFAPIENCSNLSALKVDCSDLTDRTLLRLRGLPLKELELHCGFGFSQSGLKKFFQEGDLTRLECLNVHGCSMLGDDALHVVAARCPILQVLRVGSCPRLTDEGVWQVIRQCPRLIILVLRDLKGLRGEFLEYTHYHLEALKLLDVAYCEGIESHHLRLFSPRFRIEEVPHYAVPYCGSSISAHRCFIDHHAVAERDFPPVLLISKSMSSKLYVL